MIVWPSLELGSSTSQGEELMEKWLKALVATACIAVLVGVGYFIVRDQQNRPGAVEMLRQQNDDLERRIKAAD
jgi:putative exporter of polyketide antibiotics